MGEKLVPTVRTTPTMVDFTRAALQTCCDLSKEAVAVLWAHFAGETGSGKNCWNWNLGNIKHVRGDGHDYVSLKGVWEGVTPEAAQRLVASGQWAMDPSKDHAKAVGPGKVSIIATTNHPATWFRAWPSLESGMSGYVTFLNGKRYKTAWEAALTGDYALFSKQLRAGGYYTASEAAYTKKLGQHFSLFFADTQFERAIALLKDEQLDQQGIVDQPIVRRLTYFVDDDEEIA